MPPEDTMRLGGRVVKDISEVFEALLPFEWNPIKVFHAAPQRVFKPRGLAIWGAPPGAVVRQALIGINMQLVAAYGSIPCRFFSYGQSYEQIYTLLDKGVEPPAWGRWNVASPGQLIQLDIADEKGRAIGPDEGVEVCMWGHCL